MSVDNAILAIISLVVTFFFSQNLWSNAQKDWRSTDAQRITRLLEDAENENLEAKLAEKANGK